MYNINILILGIMSGMAFALVPITINFQLLEAGKASNIMGVMFFATFPYSLKPLWSPFIDNYSIPILSKKFGRLIGWGVLNYIGILLILGLFLFIDPPNNLPLTSLFAIGFSFLAANQDIIINTYIIGSSPDEKKKSRAISISKIGFNIGLFLNGSCIVYMATHIGWNIAYIFNFIFFLICFLNLISLKYKDYIVEKSFSAKEYFNTLFKTIPINATLFLLIIFIILFKACDTVPKSMSTPLLKDLKFSTAEIIFSSQIYGLFINTLGACASIVFIRKMTIKWNLICSGILHLFTPLIFILLSLSISPDMKLLIIAMTILNFFSGISGNALNVYLASLCNKENIATKSSILMSLGSLGRIVLASGSAFISVYIEWHQLFMLTFAFGVLALFVFKILMPVTK